MAPSKEEIKNWLKEIGKDRFWLAEKCGVDKRSVDEWFTSRGKVSAKAILIIQSLMSETVGVEEEKKELAIPAQLPHTVQNGMVAVGVLMEEEVYESISLAAMATGKTVDKFIKDASFDESIEVNRRNGKSNPDDEAEDTRGTGTDQG